MRSVIYGSAMVSLLFLAFCGCSDKPLSSGSYVLSQVSFSQDECNMKEYLKDGHEIKVTMNEDSVTIHVADDQTPLMGTIFGGKFMAVSMNYDDTIPDTDCRDMWVKRLAGNLVRKNVFTGTYEFSDKTLSGSDCADEEKIGFHPPVCTSSVTFTATKK